MLWLGSLATAQEPTTPESARPPPVEIEVTELVFVPPVSRAPLVVAWPTGVVAAREEFPVPIDLELLVDESGRVEEVRLVAGAEPFAGLAVAAARGATFSAATDGGVPVAVWVPVHLEVAPPPINVSGRIEIAGGGRLPAVGLPVTLGGQSALTDAEGRFAFRGIPPGEQVLSVPDEDLKVERQILQVAEGEALDLSLWARPARLDLGIVGAYRRERDVTNRRSLTAEELRTTPGTMGDPLRAVSNLPGTVRTPLDAGWLLVRGGDPRDTGVYIDGTRVPLIYHLGGFTSVMHPGFVDRVDFYPGGQYARYGRATAGAVDLVTRPRPERLEVRAGMNIVLAGAYAAVPIGKTAGITVGARRSYLDAVLNAWPGISEEQAQIAPRFWDWQVRGDMGDFSVFGLGYVDTISASTQDGAEAAVSVTTQRVHGAWHGEVAGKPIHVKPYVSYELYDLTIAVLSRQELQQAFTEGARIEFADPGTGFWGWSAGIDGQTSQLGLRLNHVDRYANITSPDAYADVRVGRTWRVVLGARADTMFVSGQLPRAAVSPRASVSVPMNDWFEVHGDAGMYHQHPPYGLVVGLPEGSALLLERSYGGGGGANMSYGPLSLDVDAYSRAMERITAYEDDGSLGQGEGAAWGFEAMLRYRGARLAGWLTYGFSHSLRREEAIDDWEFSTYDQPHSFVAVGSADLGRNWTFASRWRYSSGFPVDCRSGGEDGPCDKYVEAYDVLEQTSTELERGRTDPFHALDLKLSRQAIYRSWHLDFYLDVQNVYYTRVAEPVISGIWEAYGTQTWGFGLPILPIIGIEGVFGG